MALTRRGFVQRVGIGAAGALTSSWIGARGRENALWSAVEPTLLAVERGTIVLASNENPVGPGTKVLEQCNADKENFPRCICISRTSLLQSTLIPKNTGATRRADMLHPRRVQGVEPELRT